MFGFNSKGCPSTDRGNASMDPGSVKADSNVNPCASAASCSAFFTRCTSSGGVG